MEGSQVNRVIWFPTGSRVKSSSRIQVFNIHDKLISLGYDSIIGYEPKRTIWHLPLNKKDIDKLDLQKDDLVVIQKFKKKSTIRIIQYLKQTPAQIGFIDCDMPVASKEIVDLVNFVIVPSDYLKKKYEAIGAQCITISDCPDKYLEPSLKSSNNKPLKCVWFGNHSTSKWKEVEYFQHILKKYNISNWQFETISNTSKATKKWNDNSFSELSKYDLSIIPVPQMTLDYKVKSANRLLQSMALGIPVIASPIPSYLDIIGNNQTGHIICNTESDWVKMLNYYSSSENRLSVLKENFKFAQKYNLNHVIGHWIKAMNLSKTPYKKAFDHSILKRIKTKAKFMGYEIRIK